MLRILILCLFILAPQFAECKGYQGSAWVADQAKYYNGASWVSATKNRYNGSSWAPIEDYSDIKLWLGFESTTTSTTYTSGSGDYPIGVVSSIVDGGQIDATAALVGSAGWHGNDAQCELEIPLTTGDFDLSSGSIAFKLKLPSLSSTVTTLRFNANLSTEGMVVTVLDTGALKFQWKEGGTWFTPLETAAGTIAAATEYCVQLSYDATNDEHEFLVNGVSAGSDTVAIDPLGSVASPIMRLGSFGAGVNIYIDNFIMSDDPGRNFHSDGLCDALVYPGD